MQMVHYSILHAYLTNEINRCEHVCKCVYMCKQWSITVYYIHYSIQVHIWPMRLTCVYLQWSITVYYYSILWYNCPLQYTMSSDVHGVPSLWQQHDNNDIFPGDNNVLVSGSVHELSWLEIPGLVCSRITPGFWFTHADIELFVALLLT